jgi:hypothetical protein
MIRFRDGGGCLGEEAGMLDSLPADDDDPEDWFDFELGGDDIVSRFSILSTFIATRNVTERHKFSANSSVPGLATS